MKKMSMRLKVIKSKKQYQEYLDWIDKKFQSKINPGSARGKKMEVVLLLIKQYEDDYYPIPLSGAKKPLKSRLPTPPSSINTLRGSVDK
jgi:HTH-type transcriptional regulator/antitoxin HigA